MAAWLFPFILALASCIAAPVASKLASRNLEPIQAALIETASTLAAIILLAAIAMRSSILADAAPAGAAWAVLSGVLWTGFTVGIYMMFAAQAPIGLSLTALRVLTVIATAAVAMIVFGEQLSPLQMAGVAVAAIGVRLVTIG